MNTILKIAAVAMALVLMLMADVPLLPVQLVPEAHAILGTRRRTAVVVRATVHAADSAQMAQAQQQTAAAQQQAAAAEKKLPPPSRRLPLLSSRLLQRLPLPPAAAGTPLPLGTVISALPGLRLHTGRRRGVLLLWQ